MLQALLPSTRTWKGDPLSPATEPSWKGAHCSVYSTCPPSQGDSLLPQAGRRTRPGPSLHSKKKHPRGSWSCPAFLEPGSVQCSSRFQKPGLGAKGPALDEGEMMGIESMRGHCCSQQRETEGQGGDRSQSTSLTLETQLNPSQQRAEPSYCPEDPGSDWWV